MRMLGLSVGYTALILGEEGTLACLAMGLMTPRTLDGTAACLAMMLAPKLFHAALNEFSRTP